MQYRINRVVKAIPYPAPQCSILNCGATPNGLTYKEIMSMTIKVLLALMLAAGGYLSVHPTPKPQHDTAAADCCTDPPPPDCPPACSK